MYTVRWCAAGEWRDERCASLEDAVQWCEMCAEFGIECEFECAELGGEG